MQAGKLVMYSLFLLTSLCIDVWSQGKISLRKVSINREDTMVLAGILMGNKRDKVYNELLYHWYSSGRIYQNHGGYTGNLLHGEYIELDKLGNLIVKGNFYYGVKVDTWTYWYSNGSIKEITRWKKGIKEGTSVRYSISGEIIFKGRYRNGRENGIVFFMENDMLFKSYYHRGKKIYRKPLRNKLKESKDES